MTTIAETKLRELLREIVAYAREAGHDWSSLHEAEIVLTHPVSAPAEQPQQVGKPVPQFRKQHCTDWYDGHPDESDGGGPYETRVLYTQSPPAREPMTRRHCRSMTSKFTTWFVAQHKPRTSSGLHEFTDQQLRNLIQQGKEAERALSCRELWDEKEKSALYAWTAAKIFTLEDIEINAVNQTKN